jgi:hypothetical protein
VGRLELGRVDFGEGCVMAIIVSMIANQVRPIGYASSSSVRLDASFLVRLTHFIRARCLSSSIIPGSTTHLISPTPLGSAIQPEFVLVYWLII